MKKVIFIPKTLPLRFSERMPLQCIIRPITKDIPARWRTSQIFAPLYSTKKSRMGVMGI
jgi:hypothetical protein